MKQLQLLFNPLNPYRKHTGPSVYSISDAFRLYGDVTQATLARIFTLALKATKVETQIFVTGAAMTVTFTFPDRGEL